MSKVFRWTTPRVRDALAALKARHVHWSVDRFAFEEGVASVNGWCGCASGPVQRVTIVLTFDDGVEESMNVDMGVRRPDVHELHPELGGDCGFFAHRAVSRRDAPETVSLLVELAEGEVFRVPIPFYTDKGRRASFGQRLRVLWRYVERGCHHLMRGNVRLLWSRLRTHWPSVVAKRADPQRLNAMMEDIGDGVVLVVDHALGGGANHYRDELIAKETAAGRTVLLWSYAPLASGFQLGVHRADRAVQLYRIGQRDWNTLVKADGLRKVVYNNCVSFPEPEAMPALLEAFVRRREVNVTILLHDFFPVCPSHFLLNHDGVYCAIPDIDVCRQCLPQISDGLVSLFQARDIDMWRQRWGRLLQGADELIAFSENTKRLYLRAYPDLDRGRIAVRPHSVDYLTGRYTYPVGAQGGRIAVVGDVNYHKGSEVFADLVAEARRICAPIEFTVIGTLNAKRRLEGVTQTGPYARDALARLLTEHQVSMVLMLSIWPETFSYVTHELMALEVPLLSFDIGAQGDAVRQYRLGRVVSLCHGEALLAEVLSFKGQLDQGSLAPDAGRSGGRDVPPHEGAGVGESARSSSHVS